MVNILPALQGMQAQLLSKREGNDNPLQYSCLENPMDRRAGQAPLHGVTRVRHNLVTKPLLQIDNVVIVSVKGLSHTYTCIHFPSGRCFSASLSLEEQEVTREPLLPQLLHNLTHPASWVTQERNLGMESGLKLNFCPSLRTIFNFFNPTVPGKFCSYRCGQQDAEE